MKITKEQFVRGFAAIQNQHAVETAMAKLAAAHGNPEFALGHSPVTQELIRQLEERCDDADDSATYGSDIQYALYERGRVVPMEGAEPFVVDSAETVWRLWEESGSGPFSGAAE